MSLSHCVPSARLATTAERVVVSKVSITPRGTLFKNGCTAHNSMTGTVRESEMNSTCKYTPPSRSSRCQ